MEKLIPQLVERLRAPLPGPAAQYRMAHAVRGKYQLSADDARVACVLIALYPKAAEWHLVLIQRVASNPHDRHGGQISFPGGRYEPSDGSLANGALREAQEEVGIQPDDVEVLGRLTELFIPVSNFMVHPFIGTLDYTPDFVPQPSEVQEIIEVPLSLLRDPASRQRTEIALSERLTLQNVPYFNVEGRVVWGATAMMLNEFLEVLG
ncbi:MAG: CoA pyrophosphatase [Bacteroidota bacterium]